MAQCTEDALGEGANCLVGELPVILKAWRKKNRIYFYCYVDVEENIIMRSYYIVSQKTNGKGFDYEYQKDRSGHYMIPAKQISTPISVLQFFPLFDIIKYQIKYMFDGIYYFPERSSHER